MRSARAPAKLNLALAVGPRRPDGRHEVVSVMQPLELADLLELEPAGQLLVEGFAGDSLVRAALEALATAAGVRPHWRVRIEKRIPVAAGLGGGSADAATALRLANAMLPQPLRPERLCGLAAALGADVPFFLEPGAKLAEGDGTALRPLRLPLGYHVLVLVPAGVAKASTGAVYDAFDERGGERGFRERRAALLEALEQVEAPEDLARLPPNDLACSPLADELKRLGAFRAGVTGAGPALYGLFRGRAEAEAAAARLRSAGRLWVGQPAW